MCKIFAEFFQGFLDVFSIDLHDFRVRFKEIFLSVIKMTVIQKAITWSFLPGFFYYNLFLEVEQPFWIHLRDQNRKLGIFGLPFSNKNESYKKGSKLGQFLPDFLLSHVFGIRTTILDPPMQPKQKTGLFWAHLFSIW